MAGLLNSPQATTSPAPQLAQPSAAPQAPQQPAQSPQSSLADPVLQKIESSIEAKVSPSVRRNYLSCVNAGMAAMFGDQMGARVMAKLKSSTNPTSDITTGIANICTTIINEIVGKVPPAQQQQFLQSFLPPLIAASATLTCHALDTVEKMGRLKVTPQMASQTIHDVAMAILQKLGIGKTQIQAATAKGPQGQAQAAPGQPGAQPGAQ